MTTLHALDLSPGVRTIDAPELARRSAEPDLAIVDVRPLEAYNGWRLADEARGGHIPGAVSFPAAWLHSVDAPEIERLLDLKGLVAGREIVIYGHEGGEAAAFAAALRERGIGSLLVLDGGFPAWAADPGRQVDRLPRHEQLVHPGWLRALLAGEPVEAAPTGRHLLFHVNFGVPEEYAENHLPTAHYLDTNWLEDPADWNRRSPEVLDTALRALGITRDTTVILYGRAGQIAATRAAMILRYAGVDDVRLLDGGYDRWVRSGGELETVERLPESVESFGAQVPVRPEVIDDLPGAKEILADRDGAALVSVRTWREHIGAVSGYNYIGPAGRIAGDVWGNCGTDAYHMQHYRNVDNTMRAYPEIAANWAEVGITPDKRVAFYCGTGWRASETWFYAWVQGWDRIAVYDGGWFEWSADPASNPIEIGAPDADPAAAVA